MKRSAAIIGPTPAFLRWAIRFPCAFREIEVDNLPGSTFRQLRSLSELSAAYCDDRVHDGVAFHPDVSESKPLLGFLVDEIEAAYGGRQAIEFACPSCPANVYRFENRELVDEPANKDEDSQYWAGCYGMFQFDAALIDIVEKSKSNFDLSENFHSTQPVWYGLWIDQVFSEEQLKVLAELLSSIDRKELVSRIQGEPNWIRSWTHFVNAVNQSCKNNLELHVELFPEGESDGSTWKLERHCENCKSTLLSNDSCQTCGCKANSKNMKKRKVLGLRPYMKMEFVLGAQDAQERLTAYLEEKAE